MRDKIGAARILVVAGVAIGMTSGCATEHASKLANMDKWQANCAKAAIERALVPKKHHTTRTKKSRKRSSVERKNCTFK